MTSAISFTRISALLLKYWYISTKVIDRYADTFFYPVISLFLWGFVTLFLEKDFQVDLVPLILVGFIFFQLMERCITDIPLYLLEDFWSDNLQNVYSTPITKWDSLISLVIFGIIKSLISASFTGLIALIMFKFNIFQINPLYLGLYVFALLLFSIGFGITLAAAIFRLGTQFQMLSWGMSFMLQPFLAIFYPVSILPYWMQTISLFIPATYVFEGLRQLRSTGIFDLGNYAFMISMNLAFIIIACILFSLAFNHNKKNGRMVHSE